MKGFNEKHLTAELTCGLEDVSGSLCAADRLLGSEVSLALFSVTVSWVS